jgi:hypothetical protein
VTSPARPYRRRPLQVESVQLTADADWEAIAQWCGGERFDGWAPAGGGLHQHGGIHVPDERLGVRQQASMGDWVVKGPEGFYTVDDEGFRDIFEEDGVDIVDGTGKVVGTRERH